METSILDYTRKIVTKHVRDTNNVPLVQFFFSFQYLFLIELIPSSPVFFCVFFTDQYYWSNFSHVLGSKVDLNDLENIFTNFKDDDVLMRYQSETNSLNGNSNRKHSYCEIALGKEIS